MKTSIFMGLGAMTLSLVATPIFAGEHEGHAQQVKTPTTQIEKKKEEGAKQEMKKQIAQQEQKATQKPKQ